MPSATPKYEYRRHLPHYQKSVRPIFVTFCKNTRTPFSDPAKTAILNCCLRGHGTKFQLHTAVVMPDHVHLLLTPLRDSEGWPYPLYDLLKLIKGASARCINQQERKLGQVWQHESFGHVLRSEESQAEKSEYLRQNPVRKGLVGTPEEYPWLWQEPCALVQGEHSCSPVHWGAHPQQSSRDLAQASRRGADLLADGFAGDQEFDSAVLLAT